MSELSSSVKHPFTPRQLDLLIPRGWDTHSEPESDNALSTIEIESDNTVLPHDIMDFLADVETSAADIEPAPPTRFAVPLSDDAVKEARKAAVPKLLKRTLSGVYASGTSGERRGIVEQKSKFQLISLLFHLQYCNVGCLALYWR